MARQRDEGRGVTPGEALLVLLPFTAGVLVLAPFSRPLLFFSLALLSFLWGAIFLGPPPGRTAAALLPALGGSAGLGAATALAGGDGFRAFLETAAKALPLCVLWTWVFAGLSLPRLAGWLQARTPLRLLPQLLVTMHRMLDLLSREAERKKKALLSRAPRLRRGLRLKTALRISSALAESSARRALRQGRAMEARGWRGRLVLRPPEDPPPAPPHLAAALLLWGILLAGLLS